MEPEGSAPKKKRQVDIGAFFGLSSKVNPNDNRDNSSSLPVSEQQKKDNIHAKSARTLLTVTAADDTE